MKKNLKSLLIISTVFIFITQIFKKSSNISNIIIFSSNLFIKNIFPSLFPVFIISSLLTSIGFPTFLGDLFSKINTKLFKTAKESSYIFFISMITGFPTSAKIINDLLDKKIINDDSANKILLFTFFSNPLFIVNTLGNIFLKNPRYGYLILISHIIGNIIIGIIFRNYNIYIEKNKTNIKETIKKLNNNINNTNIFKTLFKSIKDAINTLLTIYGVITTFLIIINILNINKNNLINTFIIGILEMTSGLKFISLTNQNILTKTLLSCFIISFGGLSVHTQIMSILSEKKIKYLPFLSARILHGLISVTILLLILLI